MGKNGSKMLNLDGQKFDNLVVISFDHKEKLTRTTMIYWLCQCSCGNKVIKSSNYLLRDRKTKSCGCSKGKCIKTHGMSYSSEYQAWVNMRTRCYNKNDISYPYYGMLGIKVCDRWLNSFENFYEDVGPKINLEYSLGRFDSNKDYEPGNVFWETIEEQNNNKSDNVKIYFDGEELTIAEWSKKLDIKHYMLRNRIKLGKPVEEILEEALRKINERKQNEVSIYSANC